MASPWGYSFPDYVWGYSWGASSGSPPVSPGEGEGTHIWGHLVMYDRQLVRHFDIVEVSVAPGDDRDTS